MPQIETAIRELSSAYDGPSLLYDLDGISRRFRDLKKLSAGNNVHILSAVKTFNHNEVHKLSLKELDGFDISNHSEYTGLPEHLENKLVSLTSPALTEPDISIFLSKRNRLHINFDSLSEINNIKSNELTTYGLRISHTSFRNNTGYPTGVDHSRFGMDLDDARKALTTLRSFDIKNIGFHTHNGSGRNNPDFYLEAAKQLWAWTEDNNIIPSYLNLGGGLHEISDNLLKDLIGRLRNIVPIGIPIIFEPGQALYLSSGYLISRIKKVKKVNDEFVVLMDMSSESNTRWSKPKLMTSPALNPENPPNGMAHYFLGATCYEGDLISKEILPAIHEGSHFHEGDTLIWNMISGYSHGWNKGFNGFPAIRIRFWDGEKIISA